MAAELIVRGRVSEVASTHFRGGIVAEKAMQIVVSNREKKGRELAAEAGARLAACFNRFFEEKKIDLHGVCLVGFGSLARETLSEKSDFDVLIVFESEEKRRLCSALLESLRKEFGEKLDYFFGKAFSCDGFVRLKALEGFVSTPSKKNADYNSHGNVTVSGFFIHDSRGERDETRFSQCLHTARIAKASLLSPVLIAGDERVFAEIIGLVETNLRTRENLLDFIEFIRPQELGEYTQIKVELRRWVHALDLLALKHGLKGTPRQVFEEALAKKLIPRDEFDFFLGAAFDENEFEEKGMKPWDFVRKKELPEPVLQRIKELRAAVIALIEREQLL